LKEFEKTWYKERSHSVDEHIVKGSLFNCFSMSYAPGINFFFEKYFVYATFRKPFWGFLCNLVKRKSTLCECAYCKGSPVQSFSKELKRLDLAFSLKNTLFLQVLLNPLGDFNETWYKEGQNFVDVHDIKRALCKDC
jgi:hypothetical protein